MGLKTPSYEIAGVVYTFAVRPDGLEELEYGDRDRGPTALGLGRVQEVVRAGLERRRGGPGVRQPVQAQLGRHQRDLGARRRTRERHVVVEPQVSRHVPRRQVRVVGQRACGDRQLQYSPGTEHRHSPRWALL